MYNFVAQNNGRSLSESVFFATNATPGTGIASDTVATAFADTEALMTIFNSASATANPSDNQYIIPVFLRLTATSINTSATNFRLIGELAGENRYTSGGTTLTSKSCSVDTRSGYTNRTPKATINFGDIVSTDGATRQRVFNTMVSEAILAVDESLEIWFGDCPNASSANNVKVVPPVWIGRGSSLSIHGVAASQAADPDFEVEFCYIESGHPRFSS